MTKNRKKEIIGKLFFTLLGCFLGIILINYLPEGRICQEGETLIRDLSTDDLKYFSQDPKDDRNIAWEQELPNFVYRDIQNAESSKCNKIIYNFAGNRLTFNYESEQWNLEIESIENKNDDQDFPRKYTNFSIYHEKENLVIYANDSTNSFIRFLVGESTYKEDVLTIDTNLPFGKEGFDSILRVVDMTMLKEGEEFNFYLKGEKIASQKFENTKGYNIKDAFILTDEGELYLLYYNSNKEEPSVKLVKVSSGVSLMKDEILMSKAVRGTNIPIFIKDGEECVAVPENWDTYENTKINSVNTDFPISKKNYNVALENLNEKFVEAEFEYSESEYDSEIGEWEIKKHTF